MVNIFTELWEGGADGAVCTTTNTAFTALISPAWHFSATPAPLTGQGSRSGRFVCSSSSAIAQRTFSPRQSVYDPIFLNAESYPPVATAFASYGGSSTNLGDLRILPSGAVQIRNSGYVAIATSPAGLVPLNAWCRIEWLYNNATGQQRLRVYTSPLGTTPAYDSGLVNTTKAGAVDTINLGAINSTTWTATIGDFAPDDAAFPSYGGGTGSGGTVGLRGSASNPTASTGTTATVVIPAATQVGDLMVLKCWGSGGGWTRTAPAGWVVKTTQAIQSVDFTLWVKTATAGDAGSTVTITSNNTSVSYKRDLHIEVYSTAQLGDVASSLAPSASTAHMTPQVTAVDPNAWVECGVGDRASPGSQSWTLPSNLVERQQHFGSGGAAVSSVTATDDVVGSGPVGSNQITGTVSTANAVAYSVVIEPATATVGGTVDAGPDLVLEPWLTGVSITATATGSPTGWSWQQLSPPDVDEQLTLSGTTTATLTLTARPDIVPVTYKLRATATYASGPPAVDDVNVTILPATEHFVGDAGQVPMRKQFLT